MNEKGISPPKGLEVNSAEMPRFYRWLLRMRQVFPKVQTFNPTLDPASVAANTTAEQTFTVNDLTTEDIVTVNKPTHTTGLGIVGARISAANTLAITFGNFTGSAIDPPSETYLISSIRR